MPLNTDPDAIPDEEYYAEYEAHIERVGDAGLHTSAVDWLVEQGVLDGEDR